MSILIACNLLWSFTSIFGKELLSVYDPGVVAWFRVVGAWVAIELLLFFRAPSPTRFLRLGKNTQSGIALLGMTTFAAGPLLGYRGLSMRDAVDGALIVALEPLIAVFLGWILLGERWKKSFTGGWVLSLVGLFFLENHRPMVAHVGLALLLAPVLFDALSTVLGKKLTREVSPEKILLWCLRLGGGLLTVLCWKELREARWSSLISPILFRDFLLLGPIGTGAGYLIWIRETRKIPVALAVLTLFLQPVLGVFWGVLLRGEGFDFTKGFGAFLILLGVLWAVRSEKPLRVPLDGGNGV